jgi:hypothetical protein
VSDFLEVCWALRWHLLVLAVVTVVVTRVVTVLERRHGS